MATGLSLRRAVFGALALFVVAMLALTGFTLLHLRQNAVKAGLDIAAARSRAFEDYLTQSLQMTALAAAYAGPRESDAQSLAVAEQALLSTLRQTPHLRSMSLLDEQGRIVVSSNPANRGITVNQDAFLPQVTGTPDVLRIGRPWHGRDFADGQPSTATAPVADGAQYFVPVVQRLTVNDHPVILLTALNPDFFVNHILQSFGVDQGRIEVLLFDGTVLFDSQQTAPAGSVEAFVARELNLSEVESGEFAQVLGTHGPVLTAYRASRLYPLVVVTHYLEARALDSWRSVSSTLLWVVLSTLLTICALTVVFYRRQVQHRALRAQARRQQQISATVFDTSAQAIIITDPDANIESVNAAFTRITGYDATEVVGRNPRLLNSGLQDKAFYQQLWAELLRHGVWHGELSNRRKDGSRYDALVTITVSYSPAGQVQQYIGVSSDITDRKKMELLLADQMRQLGTILDNSSVGITLVRNRALVWANQHTADMFGYSPTEIDQQSTRLFYPSDESYEALGKTGYAALAQSGSFSTEMEMKRKDGSLVWMRLSGKVVDANDPEAGTIWVFDDISEQRRTQTQLQQAKEAADAANLAKSRFLATMSHEIRTPMNGVLGMAQLLLMPGLSEADRRNYVHTILSSGQTLLVLLNDILDLSKIEAGKFQLEQTEFAPETLLADTCTLFSGAAQAKHIALDHQWHGALRQSYLGDIHRLRQMISNLLGNAIKFTPQGRVLVECTELKHQADTAELEFSVTDTGPGVAQDKLGLLFKPFSQADSSTTREFGGSGLGLSIVSSLAKAMSGHTGIESTLGQGSRFWFRVQVRTVANAQKSAKAHLPAAVAPPNAGAEKFKGKLLVVEDNPVNALVIESLLVQLGLTVVQAGDGQQALDAITQCPATELPDLILMDLQMPVMDGYTATQQIRLWEARQQRPPLPIIALTADAFEEDRQHCLAVGMNDFLAKPIAVQALKLALTQWLETAD